MKRILLGGAGGAPTHNVIRSLRMGGSGDHLIGMSCVPSDLLLADVEERYSIPPARSPGHPSSLSRLIRLCRPDFLHVQHDLEVRAVSRSRGEIMEQGVALYLPSAETIENAVDKFRSYSIWRSKGVPVPGTVLLREPADLKKAMDLFGPGLWLRAIEGAGGAGSLPVNGPDQWEFACRWIDRFQGWGSFTAAEKLTPESVTFLSLWHEGELVVGQSRRRLKWNFGDRTLSGVTGITGVAVTESDEKVVRTALDAVRALDEKPHGLFGVDMTYDEKMEPRATEVNIGRFFTTILFFTQAGLNIPQIYRDIVLEGRFPVLEKKVNPLPEGLLWVRGMDREPVLSTLRDLRSLEKGSEV